MKIRLILLALCAIGTQSSIQAACDGTGNPIGTHSCAWGRGYSSSSDGLCNPGFYCQVIGRGSSAGIVSCQPCQDDSNKLVSTSLYSCGGLLKKENVVKWQSVTKIAGSEHTDCENKVKDYAAKNGLEYTSYWSINDPFTGKTMCGKCYSIGCGPCTLKEEVEKEAI